MRQTGMMLSRRADRRSGQPPALRARSRPASLVLAAVMLTGAASHVTAENWPQWRGALRNGVSGEKNVPLRWTKTENITWKVDLPAWSGSTPIVWGNRVFLNVAAGSDLFLWSIDRATGAPVWKQRLGGGNVKLQKQNMSSPSPVTDGHTVWTMTGTGIVKAFDFEGKELWARDI